MLRGREHRAEVGRDDPMLRERDRDRPFAFEDVPGVDDRDGDQRTAGVVLEVVAFGRRIVERRSAGLSSPEIPRNSLFGARP